MAKGKVYTWQFACRYEMDVGEPGVKVYEVTVTAPLEDEELARKAVAGGHPKIGRNHRLVKRLVSEWEEAE